MRASTVTIKTTYGIKLDKNKCQDHLSQLPEVATLLEKEISGM